MISGRHIRLTSILYLIVIAGLVVFWGSVNAAIAGSDAINLNTSAAQKNAGEPAVARTWMVAAANPHAVRAGADILNRGGTAADAMIAVQAVLGLVEPQSSGLGGGAFLVWYDAASGSISTLDGRETASRHATPALFLDDDGAPLKFFDAVVGGISVGTPGTPALMLAAHERWGRMEWPHLFGHGISLAESGFAVSPRLALLVQKDAKRLASFKTTADYFLPGGTPVTTGDMLINPGYAATLKSLAADRGKSFYHGAIAADIVATVQQATRRPGQLDSDDLAGYVVKERPAVCIDYRGYDVCGMGPPSSGGLTVGQILGLLEGYDLNAMGPQSVTAWRLIGDASRLAFADRGRYMADSDFVAVPAAGLLDRGYLAERAALLNGATALEDVSPGMPPMDTALNLADNVDIALPSTSHISIVDAYGNALSMTTTIENAFGSRLMTKGGFLLNNELTDFSFRPDRDGVPIANRVEAGKRPRSSMAPTIVMKDGKPVLVIGSPGGSRIIGYVTQSIIAHIDWGMDVQQAVAMPHLVNRFGTYDLEAGTAAEDLSQGLTGLGFSVKSRGLNSGLHAIAITADGLEGGADPRREGLAFGK